MDQRISSSLGFCTKVFRKGEHYVRIFASSSFLNFEQVVCTRGFVAGHCNRTPGNVESSGSLVNIFSFYNIPQGVRSRMFRRAGCVDHELPQGRRCHCPCTLGREAVFLLRFSGEAIAQCASVRWAALVHQQFRRFSFALFLGQAPRGPWGSASSPLFLREGSVLRWALRSSTRW